MGTTYKAIFQDDYTCLTNDFYVDKHLVRGDNFFVINDVKQKEIDDLIKDIQDNLKKDEYIHGTIISEYGDLKSIFIQNNGIENEFIQYK